MREFSEFGLQWRSIVKAKDFFSSNGETRRQRLFDTRRGFLSGRRGFSAKNSCDFTDFRAHASSENNALCTTLNDDSARISQIETISKGGIIAVGGSEDISCLENGERFSCE